jgi:rubrerythrin
MQNKKCKFENYLRNKREQGKLTDEQIARLDAIGFKWAKKGHHTTLKEKVATFIQIEEGRKRYECIETGEWFLSPREIFARYGRNTDKLPTLEGRIRRGASWHGLHFQYHTDLRGGKISSSARSNLIVRIRKGVDAGLLSESDMALLAKYNFPFSKRSENKVSLDENLEPIWDTVANEGIDTSNLHPSFSYAWRCPKCGYSWTRSLSREREAKGCPACSGEICIEGRNDLATTNPELLADWNYERNGNLLPTTMVAGSGMRVWWRCGKCGGEWQARIHDRAKRKRGCPYCSGRKLMKGVNDLASKFPEVALDYLPELNDGIPAHEIVVNSNKKIRWRCHVCGYEWDCPVGRRTTYSKASGCRVCNQRKKMVRCVENGKVYCSVKDAAEDIGRHDSTISKVIGTKYRAGGYHWEYVDDGAEETMT